MPNSNHSTQITKPNDSVVIAVHGFLGNRLDFTECASYIEQVDFTAIDLIGHGKYKSNEALSLDHITSVISQDIGRAAKGYSNVILLGYSLGARLLMHTWLNDKLQHLPVKRLILEGGNFGLQTEEEKQLRWQSDSRWMNAFSQQPFDQVLESWYQQPIFSNLTNEQIMELVDERKDNWAVSLASVMRHTSLAKQDNLLPAFLAKQPQIIELIVGELDQKFTQIYQQCGLPTHIIADAGHNSHIEQPEKFAKAISNICSNAI
jgi:2-succinyl-6-hydroxy-2,4-cyclohexadiene-1-carboxylate synthase